MKKFARRMLGLLLSFVFLFSLLALPAFADVTQDDSGLKVTLDYKPGSILMDNDGSIFVGDWLYGNLYKYKADGTLDTSWGNGGSVEWADKNALGTCGMCFMKDGNILITGQHSSMVFMVNKATGGLINSFMISYPLGCTTDTDGNIYIATKYGINKYDSEFNLITSNGSYAYGVAVSPDGKVYYTSFGSRVYRLNSDLTEDTAFGDNGSVAVFTTYTGGLFYDNGKIYACSEADYKIKQMNLDGTGIETVINGTGPNNVFINKDYYVVPFWAGLYFQTFKRPKIDIGKENFQAGLDKTALQAGSSEAVHLTLSSDSTHSYAVTAKVYDKATNQEVTGITASKETLANGDAVITIAPPPGGWKFGEYTFRVYFSETVGNFTVTDSMPVAQELKVTNLTTVALSADKQSAAVGERVVLTAALSGGVNPTGNVKYASNGTYIGQAPVKEGKATIDCYFGSAGTKNLTAEYTGDSNNSPSVSGSIAVTINKAAQTGFAFGEVPTAKTYGDGTFTVTASGGQGTGAVTYSSSNPAVLSVDAATGLVTIKGAGTAKITAVKAADANYNEVTAETGIITVNKASQTGFAFGEVPTKTYGDGSFTVTASGGQGTGAVTYLSSDPSVLSVDAATGAVTIKGSGTATISAVKAEDANFYTFIAETGIITVNKAVLTAKADDQSINFGQATSGFTVTVTGFVNGETAGTLTGYVSPTAGCTGTEIGTHPIAVSGGNATDNYEFSYQNGTLTIGEVTASSEDYTVSGNLGWNASDVVITPSNGYTKIWDGEKWTDQITVTESSANPVTFKLKKDNGTLTGEVSIDIKVDKTLPTVTSVKYNSTVVSPKQKSELSFDRFFSSDLTVDIAAEDTASGVKSIEYQFVPKDGEADSGAWLIYDGSHQPTKSPGFTGYLAVRVTDNAGNVSELYYDGFTVDHTAPVIRGADDNGSYYIGRKITFDDSSGSIGQSVYTLDGGEETGLKSGTLLTAPGIYVLKVVDKAGNETSIRFTIKKIPSAADLDSSDASRALVKGIRDEYEQAKDTLDEPYKTEMENQIKALEDIVNKEPTQTEPTQTESPKTGGSMPGTMAILAMLSLATAGILYKKKR